ncbi:TPA: hypothetical protein ACG05V_000646 [Bacillus pacificus]|uniref:Transporter n=1 Tax=Bacillus pacificus TaxID=2026187 RepID=A0ABX6I6W4_9BACI|nr:MULTISPECIES: hypothetical protein [Bacillus cereus group]AFQ11065.1 hypothetical protein BCK_15835 [Bacillus cereus FRI-35]KXX99346.1 hypothetical protein AT277_17400 [Bacillus cereus]KXZ00844.1 hypothetical protein AT276_09500 [Bacillus cereus]MBL3792223.1 hypothetical protein [Bacillus cereus]MBL3859372.1 hypothetical protein [Bacillus cereus]
MAVELTLLHALYVICLLTIITFFIFRKDTTIICIVFIFLLALTATSSIPLAISGIFQSFIYAITELLPTILIISIIVSMSNLLVHTGINDTMISPFTKMIRTPTLAYWIIGLLMMTISFFFWPSPAVALMGAILLPVAVRVGLPPIGVAIAMNLFGHGIALSGDFVIQGAPKLTADAAGLPVSSVVSASVPLVIVMGIVTTSVAFFFLRKEFHTGLSSIQESIPSTASSKTLTSLSPQTKKWLAICIPIIYAIDILCMIQFKLQGSDATALIGGTTVIMIIIISLIAYKGNGLNKTTDYFIEGLQFGFKIFGPVIPIAALFYLGDSGFVKIIGDYLPKGSHGIINDLGIALSQTVPLNQYVSAGTLTIVGVITGLDGSGFSGISLAGSIANLFGTALGHGTATLTALGQIAAIWTGGGTLIPWALIPAAAICKVDSFELARRNFLPVGIGLIVTTIVAMFIL